MQELRGGGPRMEGLVAAIGRAAVEPAAWQDVIGTLGGMYPGIRLQFWGTDASRQGSLGGVVVGYDPERLIQYRDHFQHVNPLWLAGRHLEPGRTVANSDVLPDAELQRSAFYHDWLRPQDDLIGGGGQVLLAGRERVHYLGAFLPRAQRERSETAFLRMLDLLAPSLRAALQANHEILGLRNELAAARAGAEVEGAALVLLDAHRRVIHANNPASQLIEEGQHLALAPSGQLGLASASAREALDTLCARRTAGIDRLISIARDDTRAITCIRLTEAEAERLNALSTPLAGRPAMILVLAAPRRERGAVAGLIASHGLTVAEAEVALRLAEGMTLQEIALERAVSLHTVRNQIKSALAKTGARRQTDLVGLIGRGRET